MENCGPYLWVTPMDLYVYVSWVMMPLDLQKHALLTIRLMDDNVQN